MRIVKILLLGTGIIILLAVITVGIFLFTFDANQYKQDLSDQVKQQTGRNLTFKGDIGLSFYPTFGMELGSMSFSNAPGFGDKPMLEVNRASVGVDVLSILSFNPQIAQLILDGLSLNLKKNSQGKTNWDDLVGDPEDTSPTIDEAGSAEPSETNTTSDGDFKLAGSFGGLNITRANLVWSDDTLGVEYRIRDLSLKTGHIQPEKPFSLQLNMAVQGKNEFTSTMAFKTDVLFKNGQLSLHSMRLETDAQGELIPFESLQFILAGELGFDMSQQRLTLSALDMQANLHDKTLPGGEMRTGLGASKLELRLNQRSVALEGLILRLNENRFTGKVNVLDYARPAVNFDLTSDLFDSDKLTGYSASEPGEEPVSDKQASPPEDIQIQLPMELLRTLQVDGRIRITKLIAQGLTLSDVLLKIDADKGIINLKPLNMNLYDGSFAGAVRIDATGKEPAYRVSKKLSSFQIGRFLKDFSGDDPVSGVANLNVNLTTRGEWLSQLKSALNGKMAIGIKDGALQGFNLRHEIDSAKARLKGKKMAERSVQKTDFSALSISGVIKNGVFSSDDLNMQAPLVRVGGKGSADLTKETVDYLVNAKLVSTTKGQQGGAAGELSGLLIPVAITGPWLSPEIDVQLDEMLKAKLDAKKARLKKQLAAQKAKLKAEQNKKVAAKKAQLEKQRQQAEAAKKAEFEAEKKRKQAELDAAVKAEKEKQEQKLEDQLKKLF